MAIGNPVSYWYGTKAQYNTLSLHLADTLYFITDEQTIYKGDVRFAEGVEQLSAVDSSAPSSPAKYDKYFDTDDGKIYVYDGTSWGNAYYPAEGNMYYDKNAKRFVYFVPTYDGTTVTGGSMADVYDAGVSGDANQGVSIQGTSTVTVANASVNGKGVVKIGDNINVNNAGVISVSVANASTFGLVKTGDNITNTNGVISVAKATTSALGVVKVGTNIDVADGTISVKTGSTTDKGVVKVGTNIDVADGVISVKDASTSDKGVVQLTNSDDGMDSETTAITPKLVNDLIEDVIAAKQDNLSNGNVTTLNTTDGAKIDVNVGDGLAVGVAGSTNANKLIVNEASVKEVLEDVVDGGTEPAVNEIVTADNLRGALSVGQAVDVSCAPYKTGGTITYGEDGFLGGFTCSLVSGNTVGFYDTTDHKFPKYAEDAVGNPLHYLFIADVSGTGTITPNGEDAVVLSSTPTRISMEVTAKDTGYFSADTNANVVVSNWRQYEVNALTEKAKDYLASSVTNPNPDAFFRSTSAYSIRDKYLIKQDMVCPFIPTINMPDNSDLTVAAGLSYKIKYTNDSPHTITADTIPSDAYGWDTHIQMFIKGTSTINFQAPLVLMDALTPNAGHNMVVKWRNGDALVYVEDTDAGNIVISTSGSTAGTLNYYLTQDPGTGHENYIVFGAVTDDAVCDASSVSIAYNTNVVGNGVDKTTITGTYNVASSKTVNMQDLSISGSTINGAGNIVLSNISLSAGSLITPYKSILNNVTVLVGSTVTLSHPTNYLSDIVVNNLVVNGVVLLEKDIKIGTKTITGTGLITTNKITRFMTLNDDDDTPIAHISGVTVTNFIASQGGAFYVNSSNGYLTIENCIVVDNAPSASVAYGKDIAVVNGGTCTITSSTVGSIATTNSSGTWIIQDSTISRGYMYNSSAFVTLKGNCVITNYLYDNAHKSKLTIADDTIVDISTISDMNVSFGDVVFGDNITIKGQTKDAIIDGFVNTGSFTLNRLLECSMSAPLIIASTVNPWRAVNLSFASPLDAHKASTVQLSGTRFTSASKIISEPMRIQLHASTTVSVRGNSAPNNTDKIITAPIIVVGDNASAPSGTATIEYGVSGSTAISGLGTYIAKDGSNDFTTAITSVTASDGLGTALADANKWVKISDSLTTVETVPDVAYTGIEKHFITSNYDAIVGGTFTIPAGSTVGVTLGKDANNNVQASASTVGVNGASVTIAGSISVIGTLMLTMPNHYRATFDGTINGAGKGVITDSLSGGGYFQAVKGGSTINNVLLNKNLGYRVQSSLEPVTFNDCKIITLPGTTNRAYGLFFTNTGCTLVLNNLINESDLTPLAQIQLGTIYFNNFINNTTITGGNCSIDVYTGGKSIFNNCTLNGLFLRCFTGSEDTPSSLIFDGYNKNWTNRVMADYNITHSYTNVLLISGSTVDISNSDYTTPLDAAKLNGLKVGTFSDAANYSGTWTTATEETGAATIIASGGTYHVWGEGTFINKELNPSGVDASTKGTDLYLSSVV